MNEEETIKFLILGNRVRKTLIKDRQCYQQYILWLNIVERFNGNGTDDLMNYSDTQFVTDKCASKFGKT